jgi:hypothetical protein
MLSRIAAGLQIDNQHGRMSASPPSPFSSDGEQRPRATGFRWRITRAVVIPVAGDFADGLAVIPSATPPSSGPRLRTKGSYTWASCLPARQRTPHQHTRRQAVPGGQFGPAELVAGGVQRQLPCMN